jgi:chlorobactene glucosyltransferase
VTAWIWLALAAGAALFGLALRVDEQRRRAPLLPLLPTAPPLLPPLPTTTVLLPVRDEEHNVLPCLDGLLAQTARPPVRVIDDGSRDRTAFLVAQRAEGEPRLTLLPAGPLPPGWKGKLHALAVGVEGVETPWLLLTDADVRHAPDLLARCHLAAAGRRLDALSIAGFQEVAGPGESLLMPAVFAFLDADLGDWEAAAGNCDIAAGNCDMAADGGPAVLNGQLILLRRAAWEACGSFAAIRNVGIDDVPMAQLLRARGFRTGFWRAPDLLRVRMYRGWGETVRGWRRNLGALYGPRPAAAAGALAVALAPPLVLAAALLAGQPVAAALLWAAGASASGLLRAGSGHPPAWGLLYPLDALALAWVLAAGVRDHRRGKLVSWRGREMPVGPEGG